MRISDWSSDVCSSDLLDVADGLLDVLQDGLSLAQGRLLLEHPDGRLGIEDRVPVVGLLEAGHDLEEGGLSGTVRADDTDLGAVEEGEGDVVEDNLVTVRLADVAQCEDILSHGREPTVPRTPDSTRLRVTLPCKIGRASCRKRVFQYG